jgi:gliding motility-associated-like protein
MVNPSIGNNNTPVLLNPPYDKAAVGYRFIHNPGAFDPDGDSLSYNLTVCTREDGKPIENYTLPLASNSLYVDPLTGDLIWDTPVSVGKYNVAMEINEWRFGLKIGIVVRDMQIEVYETDNNPPVNGDLSDYCIEAGDSVEFEISSTDLDGDMVSMFATSGIFSINPCSATFDTVSILPGTSVFRFKWVSCHESVRDIPYDVLIKSEDNSPELELFDLDLFRIKVLGPSPVLQQANPTGKFIRLVWDNYPTDVIAGFNIYRREGATTFSPDSCTNGIPDQYGFEKVGYVSGPLSDIYTDTNGGIGLENGIEYTYRIVAVYPNGAESKASNELSSTLIAGTPVITNVSVISTDISNGKIYLAWKKPDRLDTIPAVGPYEYLIYRSEGVIGESYQFVKSIITADLNDTTFVDSLINTRDLGYTYKIELYNNEITNRFLIGEPGVASSTFITLSPGDRKARISITRNVPWINTRYDIFRYNDLTSLYDSIGSTVLLEYTDLELINLQEYCYYIRSVGGYPNPELPAGLINLSQEACVTPIDNEPPCTPVLSLQTDCDSLFNLLTWTLTDSECYDDVEKYNIFYRGIFDENLSLLTTIEDKNIFQYKHELMDVVAGCYAISAIDFNLNESPLSATICIDSCNFYEIPNVFTPNNDGKNDLLLAKTSGLVEKVDFKLFTRSGQLIFQTSDPKINWNGTYKGAIMQPGVYFYQCDVYERRIAGIEMFHLSGFIHLITEKGADPVIIEY